MKKINIIAAAAIGLAFVSMTVAPAFAEIASSTLNYETHPLPNFSSITKPHSFL